MENAESSHLQHCGVMGSAESFHLQHCGIIDNAESSHLQHCSVVKNAESSHLQHCSAEENAGSFHLQHGSVLTYLDTRSGFEAVECTPWPSLDCTTLVNSLSPKIRYLVKDAVACCCGEAS